MTTEGERPMTARPVRFHERMHVHLPAGTKDRIRDRDDGASMCCKMP